MSTPASNQYTASSKRTTNNSGSGSGSAGNDTVGGSAIAMIANARSRSIILEAYLDLGNKIALLPIHPSAQVSVVNYNTVSCMSSVTQCSVYTVI